MCPKQFNFQKQKTIEGIGIWKWLNPFFNETARFAEFCWANLEVNTENANKTFLKEKKMEMDQY
jgi:hypothetical protein